MPTDPKDPPPSLGRTMKITHTVESLDSPESWERLADTLGGEGIEVVRNTIRHLRVLNVESYVLEEPYIDQDYSSDYSRFYARTFRTYERYCKRVHFFRGNVTPLLERPLSTDQLRLLDGFAEQTYCGFCVIRPLSNAPVGRTVLQARVANGFDMEATVTCRADFDAHLLGTRLQVTGTSFLQQDTRVGACAQVAIWAGMRHMHARYNYNWVSVADITTFARPPSPSEAVSLPNASDRLSTNAMVRAIAEAGYQPLILPGPDIGEAILPYVESGIPVILGLDIDGSVGHAVTVIGRVFARQDNPTNRAIDYVPAYIVHDDQSGPYMKLPLDKNAAATLSFNDQTIKRHLPSGPVELNVRCHAVLSIALMSTRVFSTAARAEHNAWSQVRTVLNDLPSARQALKERNMPINEMLLDELQAAHSTDCIVLRTYLTSAAGYRRHLAQGSASDDLKDALLDFHLPHFTWVTEISTIDSYNQSSPGMRRIYGHTVLDATSTAERGNDLLALHLPGLLITNDPDGLHPQELTVIRDDRLYECREKRL